MKNIYLKIFITICIITAVLIIQSYTIEMVNTHDDLISGLGLLITVGVLLLMVWGIIKTWSINEQLKKTENGKQN